MASNQIKSAWKSATAMLLGMALCLLDVGSAFAEAGRLDHQTCETDTRILTAVVGDRKVLPDNRYPAVLSQVSPGRPYAGGPDGAYPVTTNTSPACAEERFFTHSAKRTITG